METMHIDSISTDASSTASIACVNRLIAASKPFLRIKSADRFVWRRVMEDSDDGRNGPWNYRAVYDVLDDKTWSQSGEVLYFVVDSKNQIMLVGQSSNRLKDRWKPVPMFDVKTLKSLNMHSLFHTSAWPAMEAGFSQGGCENYTIRAIFRADLERECRSMGGPFSPLLAMPETKKIRLSYHVEKWICSLSNDGLNLWNKQHVKRRKSK